MEHEGYEIHAVAPTSIVRTDQTMKSAAPRMGGRIQSAANGCTHSKRSCRMPPAECSVTILSALVFILGLPFAASHAPFSGRLCPPRAGKRIRSWRGGIFGPASRLWGILVSLSSPCQSLSLRGGSVSKVPWTVVAVPDEDLLDKIRAGLSHIRMPTCSDTVRKAECLYSFDTPASPTGLFVSMRNHQGLSIDYVDMEYARTANPLFLNVKWTKIPKPEQPELETPEVTKLAIGVEGGFDTGKDEVELSYDKSHFLALMPDRILIPLPQQELPELVSMVADGIIKASDLSEDEAHVMAWEETRQVSKYAESLVQVYNGKKISPDPATWRCEESGITEGLWLNLGDGYIGCGRAQMGADGEMSGGSGAALRHYKDQKAMGNLFPLVVKLGTISPKGADVYSYASDEDEMVEDPKLAEHLAHWGIHMPAMHKTEKTMQELQIDINLKFDFDKITEVGQALKTRSGAGYVGLENLGNSCYLNSVLQLLCSLPEVKHRYADRAHHLFRATPAERSGEDVRCQMAKVALALVGDKASKCAEAVDAAEGGGGGGAWVAPRMFKAAVAKGNAELGTGKQQDAHEYLGHLLDKLERAERGGEDGEVPTSNLFEVAFEERVLCLQSNKVAYAEAKDRFLSLDIPLDAVTNDACAQSFGQVLACPQQGGKEGAGGKRRRRRQEEGTAGEDKACAAAGSHGGETAGWGEASVTLEACLNLFADEVTVDNYVSPVTGKRGLARKRTRLKRYPKYLLVHMRRYTVDKETREANKVHVVIEAPEHLDLQSLRACGAAADEELMQPQPDGPSLPLGGARAPEPATPHQAIVAQLLAMGFGENACRKAALATRSNSCVDAAVEWICGHMEDADLNDPIPIHPIHPIDAPQVGPCGGGGKGGGEAHGAAESVVKLIAMASHQKQADEALKACQGNLDVRDCGNAVVEDGAEVGVAEYKAQYRLKGLVSHVGRSTSCGHYVCHIKKDDRWTIFNDRVVALSEQPPFGLGYIYLYESEGLT